MSLLHIDIHLKIRSSMRKIITNSILVHNPIHSIAQRGSTAIKNECLSISHHRRLAVDLPIFSSSFPIASFSGSISSRSIRVFSIPWTEEKPLHISFRKERFLCGHSNSILQYNNIMNINITKQKEIPSLVNQKCLAIDISFFFFFLNLQLKVSKPKKHHFQLYFILMQ